MYSLSAPRPKHLLQVHVKPYSRSLESSHNKKRFCRTTIFSAIAPASACLNVCFLCRVFSTAMSTAMQDSSCLVDVADTQLITRRDIQDLTLRSYICKVHGFSKCEATLMILALLL